MRESRRSKVKSGSNNEESHDDFLEGTSARTRPFSLDDIMVRRKNRGDATKQIDGGPGVADFAFAKEDGKAVHFPELDKEMNEDSGTMEVRHTSSDYKKVSSRSKGPTDASRETKKLVQDKDKSRDLHAKSNSTRDLKESSNRLTERKSERWHRSNRIKDDFVSHDSARGLDKRKARDVVEKERVSERARLKSEIVRQEPRCDDRQVARKRKTDERMSSDSENDHNRRNARDGLQIDKLADRGRNKSEKEGEHKHHSEEKYRGRRNGKNHDSDKKGLEPTRAKLDESRPKRRRSQSREHEKEQEKRLSHSAKDEPLKHNSKDKKEHGELSRSMKDKLHKHISEYKREHGELLSHPTKDESHKHTSKDKKENGELLSHFNKDGSGREHSGIDKKRISSNGSSNYYRRNTGSSSGLGGYSPRKRKTDAAAKTPSPTRRSPEKRTAGWDLHPVEKESTTPTAVIPNMYATGQSLLFNIKELPSGNVVAPPMVKPAGISQYTVASQMHAIESIQLTQATRPMRRLYAENLPTAASEKDLIEFINNFLLSSGANYVQGTQPCISCMIHKEKGQALLEFLTPEDASVALSFDGIPFSGSNLKLRRPKDYANVTTALPDKSVVAVDPVSNDVEDSSHKIFIGGISKLVPSKMLLEIAKAFGHVKAFHYEYLVDIDEPCAFLEYVDHSVTSRACAGLNGMRLGGKVVTALLATSDALLENTGKPPFYGVPEHAKPLLEKPTAILKLKNVLDPEGLLLLSESQLEEVLEDIRLESSRFGTVKSINVAKPTKEYEENNTADSTNGQKSEFDNTSYVAEKLGENTNGCGEPNRSELPEALNESEANIQQVEDKTSPKNSGEIPNQHNSPVNENESNDKTTGSVSMTNTEVENEPVMEEELKLPENNPENVNCVEIELSPVFETGSVFVEYRRAEAACMAAHCLHRRTFDGRVVTVEYVDHDLYQKRFHR